MKELKARLKEVLAAKEPLKLIRELTKENVSTSTEKYFMLGKHKVYLVEFITKDVFIFTYYSNHIKRVLRIELKKGEVIDVKYKLQKVHNVCLYGLQRKLF